MRIQDLLASGLAPTDNDVRTTVQWARHAGVSWTRIAAAVGIKESQAQVTWSPRRTGRANASGTYRHDPARRRDLRGHHPER